MKQLHSYVPIILLMSLKQLEDSVSIGAHSVSDFLGKTSLKVKANEMKQLLTKK
jgi:hypothetical protein